MLGDILLLFRIRMIKKVNGFFYYFKKLPLIGRSSKELYYVTVNLKGVLSVFSFLVDILMGLLKNLPYLFVVTVVLLINLQRGVSNVQIRSGFLFGFVLLSLVAGNISNGKLLTMNDETFIPSRQMRITARRRLCSRSWYSYNANAAGLFLARLLLSFMFSFSFWYIFMAGFDYLGFRQCIDMLQAQRSRRKDSLYLQMNTWKLLILLGSLILLYVLYWLDTGFNLTLWPFCIFVPVCAAAVTPYLRFGSSYHVYSESLIYLFVENYEILKLDNNQMKQMEAAVDEKNYTSEELQYRAKNTGHVPLNELFFRRRKHLTYKPARFRLAVTTAPWPAGTYLLIMLKDDTELMKDILELLPPFVLLSHILSIS